MKTTDCKPTLTDSQVLDFCRNGYLYLEGVVDDEVNLKATDYCNAEEHYEPSGILQEDWFIEGVILNEQASGAIRSLLGANFHLPVLMNNHRTKGLLDGFSGWHVDGNSMFAPAVNYL